MSFQNLLKNLDRGLYKDAGKAGGLAFFAAKAAENGCSPDDLVLAHRVHAFNQSYHVPESGEGARAEVVRNLAYDTFALQKAFEEFGYALEGRKAPTVEKVYAEGALQALFPIFFEAHAISGVLAASLAPDLVASEQPVNSHQAEHPFISSVAAENDSVGGEGARAPVMFVRTAERLIKLTKYQSEIDFSYEAVRLFRVDLLGTLLQRGTAQIGIDETDDLIEVAIAGDGNSGSAVVDTDADATGVLDYDETVKLNTAFAWPYREGHAVINSTNFRTLAELTPFADAVIGMGVRRTGEMVGPLGEVWHKWDSTGSASFSSDRILAVDERYALVQYTEGGLIVDSDRIINCQWNRNVISKWTGFGKLDYNATHCLDITT